MIRTMSAKTEKKEEDDGSLMMLLQEKMQAEMAGKAEAENQLRIVQKQLIEVQSQGEAQTQEFEKYKGLEGSLQQAIASKEEAENDLTMALERINALEKERNDQQTLIETLQKDVAANKEVNEAQELELQKIREQRDEQERKEMSLTNRLNAAKKKEAEKVNTAEKFEDELKSSSQELDQLRKEVQELRQAKATLEKELEETIVSSRQRQVQVEAALADERKLTEDRKHKMKSFIEKKSDELRQAKADQDALQQELNQTSRSLNDLNVRWKQLHAQWVQSQTRNRELQRDLHRIKKDSETLHKVGDSLEMKLSSSAKETEEHKNKRLAAKNELMTVLRTLENEREVAARLRDSIKFTFTPKALSQQQLLNETVEDFENQLVKLSIRLRKALPPSTADADGSTNGENDNDNNDDDWVDTMDMDSNGNSQDTDTHRLIEKLNRETQQVSKCIMAMVSGIERLHLMLDMDGDRSCYSVLNEILSAGVVGSTPASGGGSSMRQEETTAMTGSSEPRLHSITSRDYR